MTGRPALKICGICSGDFAEAAENAGVDYLGFIFVRKSPRFVRPEIAAAIAARLSGRARRVGVFMGICADRVLACASRASVQIVQLHSWYSEPDILRIRRAGYQVWLLDDGPKSFVTRADGILVDGQKGRERGGTGCLGDWDRARELAARGFFTVLAGGLGPENIRSACETGCSVLDVNSTLETAPGHKDLSRLDALMDAYRSHGTDDRFPSPALPGCRS